uniref:BZIP transcription factor n=1 Tax=Zea mays TaxID=4577 RepID=B6U8V1_MAIZE|nr:bZIP transcription factor [Zea mays]
MEFKNCGSSSQPRPAVVVGEEAALARQGSVYSLTFDEFQSALGGAATGGGGGGSIPKDFGSMNMDELLRSIWTAEETQAMASASGAGAGAGMPPTSLQRQGSSLTLPRTLSTKTVDEVWRNLVRDEPLQGADGGGHQQHHRQSTLGEMTLEEFLVRAGVVRENPAPAPPAPPPMIPPRPVPVAPKSSAFFGNLPGADADTAVAAASLGFAPFGMGDLAQIPPRAAGMGGGAMAVQAAVNQLDSGGKGYSDLSSPTEPLPFSFEGMIRGRRHGGGVEKVVERRQRRMIKNRESAARSRARKQAYTMELEAEVQKLKEQNQELERKQAEIMEMQKNELPEMLKDPFGRKKRLCLRRTLTGPW